MTPFFTSGAPTPAGHYSQAMIHGDLVYVSGQLPIKPSSGPPAGGAPPAIGTIEEQTEQALRNVEATGVLAP